MNDKAREAFEAPAKTVQRWMSMIDYAYQCRDDILSSSGETPRSGELRLLAEEMRAALQWAASQQAAEGWSERVQKRATDLHHKAAMPWPDAEALVLNEVGIDDRAIDELIGECGYAGLQSMLCSADELRQFTRSVLVHQPSPPSTQGGADEQR